MGLLGLLSLVGVPTRPTRARVAEDTLRGGQGPLINEAQTTADAALSLIPIGVAMRYPCPNPPADPRWTLEDGKTLPIADYPDLYAAMGTTWNRGDEPPGTFRISDSRGRVGVGAGEGTGLSNRSVGERLGEERQMLSGAEMPLHNHGGTNSDGHDHGNATTSDTHYHNHAAITNLRVTERTTKPPGEGGNEPIFNLGWTNNNETGTNTHSHGIRTDYHAHSIGNSGNNASHNNMQPSLVANYILRVL